MRQISPTTVFEAVRDAGSDEAVRVRVTGEVFGDTVEIDEQVDRALDEMRQQGLIELDERPGPSPAD